MIVTGDSIFVNSIGAIVREMECIWVRYWYCRSLHHSMVMAQVAEKLTALRRCRCAAEVRSWDAVQGVRIREGISSSRCRRGCYSMRLQVQT